MDRPATEEQPAHAFSEREFYQGEFRGRTLAIAGESLPAECVAPAIRTLLAGGARVVAIAPRREGDRSGIAADVPRFEGEVWRALVAHGQVAVSVTDSGPPAAARVAMRLGIGKLVWLDPGGGLVGSEGRRRSFVHRDELRDHLRAAGEATAPDARLALWQAIDTMLADGLPAVNVCRAEDLEDELFTYAGRGTLFTRERYMDVRKLGIDDYAAAHDLARRGEAEGYLARRTAAERDRMLAHGFGAFVEGRHLAGIAALLPLGTGGAAELSSLYTLTRFLGEGVGDRLVEHALAVARDSGCPQVFACTTSERVGAFFERNGFRPAKADELPPEKWSGYEPARRDRVRCYAHDVPQQAHAAPRDAS